MSDCIKKSRKNEVEMTFVQEIEFSNDLRNEEAEIANVVQNQESSESVLINGGPIYVGSVSDTFSDSESEIESEIESETESEIESEAETDIIFNEINLFDEFKNSSDHVNYVFTYNGTFTEDTIIPYIQYLCKITLTDEQLMYFEKKMFTISYSGIYICIIKYHNLYTVYERLKISQKHIKAIPKYCNIVGAYRLIEDAIWFMLLRYPKIIIEPHIIGKHDEDYINCHFTDEYERKYEGNIDWNAAEISSFCYICRDNEALLRYFIVYSWECNAWLIKQFNEPIILDYAKMCVDQLWYEEEVLRRELKFNYPPLLDESIVYLHAAELIFLNQKVIRTVNLLKCMTLVPMDTALSDIVPHYELAEYKRCVKLSLYTIVPFDMVREFFVGELNTKRDKYDNEDTVEYKLLNWFSSYDDLVEYISFYFDEAEEHIREMDLILYKINNIIIWAMPYEGLWWLYICNDDNVPISRILNVFYHNRYFTSDMLKKIEADIPQIMPIQCFNSSNLYFPANLIPSFNPKCGYFVNEIKRYTFDVAQRPAFSLNSYSISYSSDKYCDEKIRDMADRIWSETSIRFTGFSKLFDPSIFGPFTLTKRGWFNYNPKQEQEYYKTQYQNIQFITQRSQIWWNTDAWTYDVEDHMIRGISRQGFNLTTNSKLSRIRKLREYILPFIQYYAYYYGEPFNDLELA